MSLHCIVWIIKFACLFDVIKNRAHMSFYFFIRIHVIAFWAFQFGIKCSLPILMDEKNSRQKFRRLELPHFKSYEYNFNTYEKFGYLW